MMGRKQEIDKRREGLGGCDPDKSCADEEGKREDRASPRDTTSGPQVGPRWSTFTQHSTGPSRMTLRPPLGPSRDE